MNNEKQKKKKSPANTARDAKLDSINKFRCVLENLGTTSGEHATRFKVSPIKPNNFFVF